MPLNPAQFLPEAKALFEVLEPLQRLGHEQAESLLGDVLFDLATVAVSCGLADSSIKDAERLVIAVFLRYPFLNEEERREIEAWRLLTQARKLTLLHEVNAALSKVPGKLPERLPSVDALAHVGGVLGVPDMVTRFCSHVYRFAQIIARAHETISESEAKVLELLWERLASQQKDCGGDLAKATAGGFSSKDTPRVVHMPKRGETAEQVLAELDGLIGLAEVKRELRELVNLLKIQKSRTVHGLKAAQVSLHVVFVGPPGTGKTTVARIYGRALHALGFLEKGQLVETDRAGLVAEYVGQTAPKVDAAVLAAAGGVLFIDEAYSLRREGAQGDFGQEAIETLLKRMEDKRDKFVVVVAGYDAEMQQFLEMNPGLASRFPRQVQFPHYSSDELEQIFNLFASQADYCLSDSARMALKDRCKSMGNAAAPDARRNFGNARAMRNLFEHAVRCQASRLTAEPEISKVMLETLEAQDLV